MRSRSLVVGIAVVLAACGGTSDSAPASGLRTSDPTASSSPATPAAASALPSTAPTPAPSTPPAASVALQVEGDAPQFLTRWGDGFVALGTMHVWESDDGLAWDSAEIQGIVGGAQVRLVERSDGTLLAFGFDPGPATLLRTWTSADGRNWQAADIGLPTAFVFLDIGRGERGYVLAGRALLADASPEQLWFSPDAITWELMYATSENESIAAVGAGPEGFVAVGQQGFRSGPPRAFVLASADGRQWIKAPEGGALDGYGSLWSVAPLAGDWVTAPLTIGTALPLLWSPNGLDWEERASLPIESDASGVSASLLSDGGRLFAAVEDRTESSVLWTSSDGTMWSETDIPRTGEAHFASVAGATVFLVNGTMHVRRY